MIMRQPVPACGTFEPAALKVIAPGDDMRPGDNAEFLGANDAGEPHEVADGDLLNASGAKVGEVVEPLDLQRDVGEALELGRSQAPVGRGDWGRELVVHGTMSSEICNRLTSDWDPLPRSV
jgi:hypothetical protein